MSGGEVVPLFPLKAVLFPGGLLPLRIFEARYLDMIGRCMRSRQPFGVLMIVEGSEVGPAQTASIGTLAEVVDWRREPDGLLGISVAGRDRFSVSEVALQDDGLYVGRATRLAAEPSLTLPADYGDLARLLQQVLPKLGGGHEADGFDDATWVGYRLAEILPLTLDDKQACLEMQDPLARLDRLRAAFN